MPVELTNFLWVHHIPRLFPLTFLASIAYASLHTAAARTTYRGQPVSVLTRAYGRRWKAYHRRKSNETFGIANKLPGNHQHIS